MQERITPNKPHVFISSLWPAGRGASWGRRETECVTLLSDFHSHLRPASFYTRLIPFSSYATLQSAHSIAFLYHLLGLTLLYIPFPTLLLHFIFHIFSFILLLFRFFFSSLRISCSHSHVPFSLPISSLFALPSCNALPLSALTSPTLK